MKNFYPAFIDISGRDAVVIGGGAVAERKAISLLEAGARVTVISPELSDRLAGLAQGGVIIHLPKEYQPGDLAGAFMVFAATDRPEVNSRVASDARGSGILINCAKPPDAGDFIVPSTINRASLTVAISTGGGCPALTKKLRTDLEAFLGDEYGGFLEFLAAARKRIRRELPDENDRRAVLGRLVSSEIEKLFIDGPGDEAALKAAKLLDEMISSMAGRN